MRAELEPAIRVLTDKIRTKEGELLELKRVVNRIYAEENEAAPYNISTTDSAAGLVTLRSDLFYNKTLAQAAQEYLEMRKARGLGSATVNDIYKTLKEGGYNFETSIEDNAKNGVRISLRKNSTIFHQLPSGDYGLCVWYGIKTKVSDEESPQRSQKGQRSNGAGAGDESLASYASFGPVFAQAVTPQEASRRAVGVAGNSGVVTVGELEAYVGEKNRRIPEAVKRFSVTKDVIESLLEPKSKVYHAGRGWLKIRESEEKQP